MALSLRSEGASDAARILVVGAGAAWSFDGGDPSAEMLKLATTAIGPNAERVSLREGLVDVVADARFDAAACLPTPHLLQA